MSILGLTDHEPIRVTRWLRLLVVAVAIASLMLVAQPARADAWAATRHCWPTEESCYVRSRSTGDVEHERCTTQFTNCELKGAWSNGATLTWRSSWHGGGSQGVLIYTTGSLASQSATCICIVQNCPV